MGYVEFWHHVRQLFWHRFSCEINFVHCYCSGKISASSWGVFQQERRAAGERLTSSRRTPHPVSNSSSSIWTRTNVSFGSRPPLMTLMNSIQALSFVVSWSHSPAGPLGDVNKGSFIFQKSPSVQSANGLSSADRCYLIRHAAPPTSHVRSRLRACRRFQ